MLLNQAFYSTNLNLAARYSFVVCQLRQYRPTITIFHAFLTRLFNASFALPLFPFLPSQFLPREEL